MNTFTEIFSRGVRFVRDNPQIIYTLFLLIVIPLAFFYTNDRFASIARTSQDRLEYSKISFLHDGFVLFGAENFFEPERLTRGLKRVMIRFLHRQMQMRWGLRS